ncbi:hypothetical protein ABIE67_000111 [Streptomyces sp. V4I8]|uniref:hypothetical protein n=1 Tax=Streptomyces sp. V4I8 TaxID=3156469 RepID=UPI0035127566
MASGTINDPAAKCSYEVDIVVRGERGNSRQALLALVEAKWNDIMGMGQRLLRIRTLLTARRRN